MGGRGGGLMKNLGAEPSAARGHGGLGAKHTAARGWGSEVASRRRQGSLGTESPRSAIFTIFQQKNAFLGINLGLNFCLKTCSDNSWKRISE